MSGEPTHRSGPRVYHEQDGDYTQKIEDKDGKITFQNLKIKKKIKNPKGLHKKRIRVKLQ